MMRGDTWQALPTWDQAIAGAGAIAVGAAAGLAVYLILFRALRRVLVRDEARPLDSFLRHCSGPAAWALPLTGVMLALPAAGLSGRAERLAGGALTVALTLAVAWFFARLTRVLKELVLARYDVGVADNLQARKVHTQIEIVRKIVVVIIAIVAFAAVLLAFDRLRELGAGILASAGLAGLVLGFAAQRSLANLLAGFQIAITQPVRLDDVVVVEGEWGRIEEITLTYVVVRIWDERRLILPISYFLESPFQNWTRTTARILGTVFFRVDYRVPAEEVRRKLGEIVESSPHFDGHVWRLHVTEAGDRTVEMRALMSAPDSPAAWELRCEVREKLLAWLSEAYPEGLPRLRAELDAPWPREAARAGSA